jgi:prevent-host-death family protein
VGGEDAVGTGLDDGRRAVLRPEAHRPTEAPAEPITGRIASSVCRVSVRAFCSTESGETSPCSSVLPHPVAARAAATAIAVQAGQRLGSITREPERPLCTHETLGTLERMTQPLPREAIRDVRAHLAEVVERADRDDVPTVITRRGKEVAAVVSIEVLRKYQEWEEREINRIIDERMANPASGIPIEDIMRETLARGE